MLSEELLKQTAEELAQCQHQFSEEFERKMQLLFSSVTPSTRVEAIDPETIYN